MKGFWRNAKFDGSPLDRTDWSVYALIVSTSTGRELLVQAGLQRFLADGYAATGINTILQDAGVPKGSFYHHFASKEAFAVDVLRAYAACEVARCTEIFGETKLSPLKRLRKYFKAMIIAHGHAAPVSGCLLGALSLELVEHSPELRRETRAAFDHWQSSIAALLSAAVAEGELPKSANTGDLSALIVNHWEGAHVRAKAEQSDKPFDLFMRFTFDTLLKA